MLKHLSSSLSKRLWRLRRSPLIKCRLGALWYLNPRDYIDNRLLARVPFESKQIDFCRHLIQQYDLNVFLDIGANFGLYSVLMGVDSGIDIIHAFEPIRLNVERAKTNIALNHLSDVVTVHPVALGQQKDKVTIQIDPSSTGVSRISRAGDHHSREFTEAEQIEVCVFDDFLPLSGEKVLAKIDVEGHTLEVLQGMSEFLVKNSAVLQIEFEPDIKDDIIKFMKSKGYSLFHQIDVDGYFSNIFDVHKLLAIGV